MDAAPEPRVDNVASKSIGGVVVTHGIEVARRAGSVETADVEVDVVGTEEFAKYLGHGRRVRTVSSRVFGMVRRRQEWPPSDLFGRRRIVVVESRYRPI